MPRKVDDLTAEEIRLEEARARTAHWQRWGPYLSERAWGTVREDYSAKGDVWEYLPHEHSRSRAYRWNEDGIAGICDRHQYICFAVALWNERDPFLKERLFGLTGNQGNHGEDVKEQYFYLDSTPTHSYMKYLYKYPHAAFPYARLLEENRRRDRLSPEFELMDTGVFAENRYFDVAVEYAKASPEDVLIRIKVTNRGPERAELHMLPTIWFRNTWTWGREAEHPRLYRASQLTSGVQAGAAVPAIELAHVALGRRWLACEAAEELLFTENETNYQRVFGQKNVSHYTKDGINDYIVNGAMDAVNPEGAGTKASSHYRLSLAAGETRTLRLRMRNTAANGELFGEAFDKIFAQRIREADEFYATTIPRDLSADAQNVMRQSFAGLLWSKQFYHYVVRDWLEGDPAFPPPPADRLEGRNHEWVHLYNADVISMPDKWEYPWYAAWATVHSWRACSKSSC